MLVTSDISSWSIILHSSLQVAKEEMLHVHCSVYLLVIIKNKTFCPLKRLILSNVLPEINTHLQG